MDWSCHGLVFKIRNEGSAVLLVEQNVKAALRISDIAPVIEHGKIVFEGDAQALSNHPRVTGANLDGQVRENA